jgi:hypothetical protein
VCCSSLKPRANSLDDLGPVLEASEELQKTVNTELNRSSETYTGEFFRQIVGEWKPGYAQETRMSRKRQGVENLIENAKPEEYMRHERHVWRIDLVPAALGKEIVAFALQHVRQELSGAPIIRHVVLPLESVQRLSLGLERWL